MIPHLCLAIPVSGIPLEVSNLSKAKDSSCRRYRAKNPRQLYFWLQKAIDLKNRCRLINQKRYHNSRSVVNAARNATKRERVHCNRQRPAAFSRDNCDLADMGHISLAQCPPMRCGLRCADGLNLVSGALELTGQRS